MVKIQTCETVLIEVTEVGQRREMKTFNLEFDQYISCFPAYKPIKKTTSEHIKVLIYRDLRIETIHPRVWKFLVFWQFSLQSVKDMECLFFLWILVQQQA